MSTMNGKTTANQAAPDLLTVEEAARVLRIGRTKAYELARLLSRDRWRRGPAGRAGRSSAASPAPRARAVHRWPDHVADPARRTRRGTSPDHRHQRPTAFDPPTTEPDSAASPSAAVLGSHHAHPSRSKSPLPDR